MRDKLYGNLPIHQSGLNIGRIDRVETAKKYGFTHSEIIKAYNCWINIFRIPESTLTFEQYLDKMIAIGITPSDVGKRNHDYNLSRYNDEGPYTKESCRFITQKENLKEQKTQSAYANTIEKYGVDSTRQMLSKAGRKGGFAIAGKPRIRG